ncbi:recombinase family protein [Euryhalocaulis caribicus]|uniref:recombinase family protein n=1 Tax=Euryhalocaulis caribicus TaxID=1161401 RepID=UPI00039F4224|nr:recombinase family protein [Euryhalocaulis caribicus]
MTKKVRCAIYTRKSSQDGLEQDYNSLQSQRDACAAYIASQASEGWTPHPDHYDDGGVSGGTLDRPALHRLLEDVERERVDLIVVYKVDRLTRSLSDFAKLVERLDAAGASFVSVTQSFNTSTSMGRLTLNMLLSFAQFEREVTGERIRDKLAASKAKGMWMGGATPYGYRRDGRSLAIDPEEAIIVRALYSLYDELGSIRRVKEVADERGYRTRLRIYDSGQNRGGVPFTRGALHHLLTNPVYAGRIRHKAAVYGGLHDAIIAPQEWDRFQDRMGKGQRQRGSTNSAGDALFAGRVFDETGDRLTPTHAKKGDRRYRYYISRRLVKQSGERDVSGWRLPAGVLERAVMDALVIHFKDAQTLKHFAKDLDASIAKGLAAGFTEISDTLGRDQRAASSLVERIDLQPGALRITLDAGSVSKAVRLDAELIPAEALSVEQGFTLRRRGVETRFVFGDAAREADQTLIRAIAKSLDWLDQVKSGRSIASIARQEGVGSRHIRIRIKLAFLSPVIVKRILAGEQPIELTTEQLARHIEFSDDWRQQPRELGFVS